MGLIDQLNALKPPLREQADIMLEIVATSNDDDELRLAAGTLSDMLSFVRGEPIDAPIEALGDEEQEAALGL
jgi:hypothetical protein